MNEKATTYNKDEYTKGYAEGYNKAIDDFAEKLKAEYDNNMRIPEIEVVFAKTIIEQVKEQLKGGTK